MDRSKCREYTRDEIIESFFEDLDNRIEYGNQKDSTGRVKGRFISSRVMDALDGEQLDYSYLELIAIDERTDISGELHSLFLSSNERLASLLNQGIITDMTVGFVRKVKELTERYDSNSKMSQTELVASILDVVDNGINGKKLRLDIGSTTEDKQELLGQGSNYYPTKQLTISGDLGKRYREKQKNNPTLDPRYVVKNAAISKKIPERKVNALTEFWNKVTQRNGGTKDER